jgi:hypothetical protein
MALSRERLALYRAALAGKGLAAPRAPLVPRRADATRAPLSFAQERLFFLELYEPGTALYNDCVSVHVEGELDVTRLARAFQALQARHEILRTTFALGATGPEQRVHAPSSLPAPLRVFEVEPEGASAFAASEAARPFALESAPPWRAALARLGAHEWRLVVTMHHLLSDGATMGILFDELAELYAQRALGAPELEFGDYAAWERAALDERRAADELAYWQAVLAGPLPRYTWRGAHGTATRRGGWIPLALSAAELAPVEALARSADATTNHVFLAAWLVALGAWSGSDDQRTGIACSLRTQRALEGLPGFFVQSLVLRTQLATAPDFTALVRTVRAAALEAQTHAQLPFDRVVRACEPRTAGAAGVTLAPTFFSHMKDAIRAPRLAGAKTRWEFVDPGVARFELALVLHESAEGLSGILEHDEGVFTRASATRMAAEYARLLAAAALRPNAPLAELAAAAAPPPATSAEPRRAARALPVRARRATGDAA